MNLIDTDAYHFSGIEVFQFPGGEWHANVPKWPSKSVHVEAHIRTWDDMGKLMVVCLALIDQGVKVYLFCPYLPGARQDRNPDGLTPPTAAMYSRLLEYVSDEITAVDVHSEIASGMYNKLHEVSTHTYLKELVVTRPDYILIPDVGGIARGKAAAELFGVPVVRCGKKRDFGTGKLTGFIVPDLTTHAKDARYLIVDDICDGGGTFVGLLEEFRKQQATALVDLYVTHGIFSKGLEVLSGFDNIYTTDSFYRPDIDNEPSNVFSIELTAFYFGGLRP